MRDKGSVTSRRVRIASAGAAVVVSAVVAGAALFSSSALGDPGSPIGQDDRLVAVPATPTPSPDVMPNEVTPRSDSARAHSRPECQRPKKPTVCHRESSLTTATPVQRSSKSESTRTAPTPAKRSRLMITETYTPKPAAKRSTKTARSTPAKNASSSSSVYATRSDWADAVLDELNAERARHGLAALKLNSKLTAAAHAHNLAMAKANKLSHQLSGEAALGSRVSAAGYRWSAVGENVAYNSDRSESGVLAVQKAMYNEKPPEDGHRKNILSKTYVDVGVDVISDSVHDKVWLVTDFGKS